MPRTSWYGPLTKASIRNNGFSINPTPMVSISSTCPLQKALVLTPRYNFNDMRKLFILSSLILQTALTFAQLAYDKEKIYIHTDHVFFAPGETLFFKLYLVKGSDNTPSKISKAVYVEVYGPSGTVVEKQTYPVTNGYCEGSYTLADLAPGGLYKLKAFTSWML